MVPNGVSIITTTWNERENITKLIPAIRSVLGLTQHEIIVVDDSSPDGAIHIAKLIAGITITKLKESQTENKIPS